MKNKQDPIRNNDKNIIKSLRVVAKVLQVLETGSGVLKVES